MKTILEFSGVGYSYENQADGNAVVSDLSFTVREGEFVALIGNNGAGKTTTSKLMNGLLKPSTGTVLVEGEATSSLKTSMLARKVGMLFQDPDKQICQNTVYEELAFGLKLRALPEDEVTARVESVLADFGFDGAATPYMLSRGERQLLALASVVVCEPEVLILDEPTTGLDYRECMHIMGRIKELNLAGTTVIMICHDMELVFDFAGRVIAMANGRLIADGAPETVFRNTDVMQKASILPPMMIDLSLRLAQEPENGKAFAHVATAFEMLQVLQAAGFKGKKVV